MKVELFTEDGTLLGSKEIDCPSLKFVIDVDVPGTASHVAIDGMRFPLEGLSHAPLRCVRGNQVTFWFEGVTRD